MRIDLSQILEGRCTTLEGAYSYTPGEDGVLLPDRITLRGPISVHYRVTDNHGYLTLKIDAEVAYDTVCDRCLDPISVTMPLAMERLIETDSAVRLGDVEHDEDYEDSLLPLINGGVDVDNEITEAVALNLPLYHLCREDCPGLCPKCGKRLADGDCGCSAKKEIDPRLAILQKLLEKHE